MILCGNLGFIFLNLRSWSACSTISFSELISKSEFTRKILSSLTLSDFLIKESNFFSTLPWIYKPITVPLLLFFRAVSNERIKSSASSSNSISLSLITLINEKLFSLKSGKITLMFFFIISSDLAKLLGFETLKNLWSFGGKITSYKDKICLNLNLDFKRN